MTIIELFDREPFNNIALHLLYPQAKVVYIGSKDVMTRRRTRTLDIFYQSRGYSWTPEYVQVDRFDPENILSAAEDVWRRHPDSVLDITGGDETALITMGILTGRHGIPLVRVIPGSGTLSSVFGAPKECPELQPITVHQLVTLYGGSIVDSCDIHLPASDALCEDVLGLWKLCSADHCFLNRTASQLNLLAEYTNELYVDTCGFPASLPRSLISSLGKLSLTGYILGLNYSSAGIRFSFRDMAVKQLLTKAGTTLEIFTRLAAKKTGLFSDICQGVTLDWDGNVSDSFSIETRNEADVILLRGMTPVFISCKNGEVKKEALYELNVVAERFGGEYAKKVLVCSRLSGTPSANESLRQRARDMGIRLIEDVYTMDLERFSQELEKIR